MHVEVDDRDAPEAQLSLSMARRNGDVPEDAEAHRGARERVVTRRANECEPLSLDLLDRAAGGESRRLPGGRAGVRVPVEPRVVAKRLDGLHVRLLVDGEDRLAIARTAVPVVRKALVQPRQPPGSFGMDVVVRAMQVRERRVADQVHVSASSKRAATRSRPALRAWAAPAAQSGITSGSGGSGAAPSIVAMRR